MPARSGPLMFIRGRYGHGGRIGYDKEWRADPAIAGGGELIDQGVHLIDLRAGSSAISPKSRATRHLFLEHAGGGQWLSGSANGAGTDRLAARQLHGVEEPVLLRDFRPRRQAADRRSRRQLRRRAAVVLPDAAADGPAGDHHLGVSRRGSSWQAEFAHFRDCIEAGASAVGNAARTRVAALEVVEQIYRAIRARLAADHRCRISRPESRKAI